jgi:hypothetical protein
MHNLFRVSVSVELLNKAGKIKFVLGLVWKTGALFALCHLKS